MKLDEELGYAKKIMRGALIGDTWQTLSPCDVLLVRSDNNCGYTFQGRAYAHLLDSFGDLCTKKSLTVRSVAKPFSVLVGTRAYHSPVSCNLSMAVIRLNKNVLKLLKNADVATQWAKSHQIALWCKILDKSKPKVIVGIQPDEYLCRAGKIKGVPVYDLQHGVIADENPWYGEKYGVTTPIEDLPDGFLCWDDQSVATIFKWAHGKGIQVLNVGNPWFLRFLKGDPDDLLVQTAVAQGNIRSDTHPCVLVSLQWGLKVSEPDIFPNGAIIDALEKVILNTENTYNWILRLHPVQIRGGEREMILRYLTQTFGEQKAQEWFKSSLTPLPIILSQADLHITYNSTTVIEAAWMGCRSGLLNQQLCEGGKRESYYSYERSIGMAELLPHDPEFIEQWISDTLTKGRAEPMMKVSSLTLDAFIEEIVRRCNYDK